MRKKGARTVRTLSELEVAKLMGTTPEAKARDEAEAVARGEAAATPAAVAPAPQPEPNVLTDEDVVEQSYDAGNEWAQVHIGVEARRYMLEVLREIPDTVTVPQLRRVLEAM